MTHIVDAPRRRILLIEDNEDLAESLAAIFGMSGHSVDTAYDGASGLERARAVAPDVVVCDLGLPTLTGLQIARAIRRDPALMDIKLIALTAYDRAPEAIAAGFDSYVQKPPDLKKLAFLIAH